MPAQNFVQTVREDFLLADAIEDALPSLHCAIDPVYFVCVRFIARARRRSATTALALLMPTSP